MDTYWKLTADEVLALARKVGLPRETAEAIISRSNSKPEESFDLHPVRVPLNRAGTVFLQSIHFYGAAGPLNPHYYAAEITHTATNAAFSRFINRIGWAYRLFRQRMAWTY
jgi:hypothetical protein